MNTTPSTRLADAPSTEHPEPCRFRVRYADTDAAGVVYHANYLAFFESGRVHALREAGVQYTELVAAGMHTPVIDATVHYARPARFDDVLLIYAWVSAIERVRFQFSYQVRRESDDALIATGATTHACVDLSLTRPVRLPQDVIEVLRGLTPPAPAAAPPARS